MTAELLRGAVSRGEAKVGKSGAVSRAYGLAHAQVMINVIKQLVI
jgi:hypothetical protein